MKKFICALLCIVGMSLYAPNAQSQMTTVTGSGLRIGSTPISTGTVCGVAVDANENPISVAIGGGGMQGIGQSCATISAGAITTAIGGGSYTVADEAAAGNSGFYYTFTVKDTSTGNPTSGQSFQLHKVPGVAGSSFALDRYVPVTSVSTLLSFSFSTGSGAPVVGCSGKSFYQDNSTPTSPVLYSCGGDGTFHAITAGDGNGTDATITIGSTATGAAGSSATVTNSGTSSAAVLHFTVPQGIQGIQGATGTTGATGTAGTVGATGSTGSAGAAATIAVGTVTTGAAGSSAIVSNAGTSSAAVFNFTIPQGVAGSGGSGLGSNTVGNLSPLFTASLGGTPLTAPALTFTAATAAQNAVLAGPASGGTGAYSFRALVAADIPTLNQPTTGNAATATLAATASAVAATGITGTIQAAQEPARTGDVTNSAGSTVTTLATVNTNVGSCGDATHVGQVTLDAKGRATACAAVAITSAGTVNASAMQSALSGQTGCTTAGYFWSPQSNTCLAAGSGTTPGSAGLYAWSGTAWVIATATQVQSILASDTVDNSSFGFSTGSGGDSTCPTPVTGRDYFCMKAGVIQKSHNGGSYAPAFSWSCQPGVSGGPSAITAGTYTQTICYNTTGETVSISGLLCQADSGTSTCAVTNGAGTSLLTGAITGTSTYAAGTQSATVTLAPNDYLKVTFVLDGTTKDIGLVVAGSY